MFGFRRNRQKPGDKNTAGTFVEATGGGWSDLPDEIPADGGDYADFVGTFLSQAQSYARQNVAIGESFNYTVTDIPRGITSPAEIMMGIMMRAQDYGLTIIMMHDETAEFIRAE